MAVDLPMQRLSEIFNVNTFIVSQVNPFVIPFINDDGGGILGAQTSFIKKLKAICGNELIHWINQLSSLGLIPEKLKRILGLVTQNYKGTVTITPNAKFTDYIKLLRNPTPDFIKESTRYSELNTYNKVSLIRSVYEIEREINDCFQSLQQFTVLDDEVGSKVSYDFTLHETQPTSNTLLPPPKNGKGIKKSKTAAKDLHLQGLARKSSEDISSNASQQKTKKVGKHIISLNVGDIRKSSFTFQIKRENNF